jgi:hypothetical protein
MIPDSQTKLDSVTFYLYPGGGQATYDFAFYVYKWAGTRITGDCLFSSPKTYAPYNNGYPVPMTFSPDVDLMTNTSYVWFITSSPFFDGLQSRTSILCTSENNYLPGKAVLANNGSNFASLSTTDWTYIPDLPSYVHDLAFTMVFTPEPATLLLLGLGAAIIRKRKV